MRLDMKKGTVQNKEDQILTLTTSLDQVNAKAKATEEALAKTNRKLQKIKCSCD